jgi:hypothetical protein
MEEEKMFKKPLLILLFGLIFSVAALLGNTPVGAEETATLTGFSINNGLITGTIGETLTVYYTDPTTGETKQMTNLIESWDCPDPPPIDASGNIDISGCYQFDYSSMCFGLGSGIGSLGTYRQWSWP